MENQRIILLSSCFIVWCGLIGSTSAQFGARNTVPETIASCYRNTTAYYRYTRQPMHIDNLIAIIRKIEKKDQQWDMRRIARTLVNRYMFDGIEFDPQAKPEFQYNPKTQESTKTQIIKTLIPQPIEEFLPTGVLDNDEMCALHWMLSHSMNATVRDDELNQPGFGTGYSGTGTNPNTGYNQPGYNQPGYNQPGNNGLSGYQRGKRWATAIHDNNETETNSTEEEVLRADDIEKSEEISGSHENVNEIIPEASSEDKSDEKPSVPVLKSRLLASDSNLDLPSDSDVSSGSKFARQVSQNYPGKTRRPIETGVVYTRNGAISAGRLIAGIAAGLEPVTMPIGGMGSPYPQGSYGGGSNPGPYGGGAVPSNPFDNSFNSGSNFNNPNNYNTPSKNQYPYGRRKKRQTSIQFQALQSVYGVTLAGDVGQAAIMNGQYPLSNVPLPRGLWNDTICPREYILEPHPNSNQEIFRKDASWSYLTEAEIRGGMDGLIIGQNIQRWDISRTLKLSEILTQYYSEDGIAGEPQYRACSRGSLFNGAIDPTTLKEQCRSFAFLFNNHTQEIPIQTIEQDANGFYQLVEDAYQRMSGITGSIGSIDPICKRNPISSGSVDTDDNLKTTEIKAKIYAVLDHTATYPEIEQQKRFLAQLSHEIEVSPKGARLGVVDGNSGMMLISPNFTDNSAILACRILSIPTQMKTQDNTRVLNNIRSELEKLRAEEERLENSPGESTGTIILIMVQGKKLEDGQKAEINRLIREITNQFGDSRVMFTSSKYQQSDFDGFALDSSYDFIKINQVQNISDNADEFATLLRKKSHGRLSYTRCNVNKFSQDEEHKIATDFFVSPNTIQYYTIAPDYFYSSKNLRLRFTSDNGKVRVCQSRNEKFPNSKNNGQNGVSCLETSGTYVTPGSAQVDVEFSYSKPCGKHGDRSGCVPIYISVTPTTFAGAGAVGLDCTIEGCQSSNQAKVTFTHWDMRCNGAFRMITSLPMALATVLLSLLVWKTSN